MMGLVLGACVAGAAVPAAAKKKKPATAGEVKKEQEPKKAPGDKGTNEGAQGRQNATEDAARASEGQNNSYNNPR
jgi:hypothetical protein